MRTRASAATSAGAALARSAPRSLIPGTGCQLSVSAGLEYRLKRVHCAAKLDPVPEQEPKMAKARSPTVSRSVTRSPPVFTGFQVPPPSWVENSSGPKAQPLVVLRNRIWPTPVGPAGRRPFGAGPPDQVCPASSVRATEVQYEVAHCPGTPPGR